MIQFFLHFSLKYLNRKHGRCKTIDQRHVSLEKIPIALEKSYEMEAFVNGYHVHKEMWTPFLGEKLDTAMQPNNVKDKYAVAIFQEGKQDVIGHFPLGKSGKFVKTIFHFLKENRCQIIVHGKAVNQNDGLGMKHRLDCYLQQKKNSSLFSKEDFLNCCNYIAKESEIKKVKPNFLFHLFNLRSDA